MDWRAYADKARIDVEQIKADLPLEWVISQKAGILLEQRGEKAAGLCPFHDDSDPSLDIYADGQRWGCFPCGLDGDLFDFIGQYWGLTTFPAQLEQAQNLLTEFETDADTWERISRDETPAPDQDTIVAEARSAWQLYEQGHKYPLVNLLQNKTGLGDIDPDWLHRVWHVGVDHNNNIVAPYLALNGTLVSYKTRYSGSAGWYARKGGKLTCMYGEHQLTEVDIDTPIWIFEGETDTWLGSWLLADRGVALGLPTGAGSTIRPEWIDLFRQRKVTVVFDDDEAGRNAARNWYQALTGVALEFRLAWPTGGDLCESGNPNKIIHSARSIPPIAPLLTNSLDGNGYAPLNKDGTAGTALTNWRVKPHKKIVNTDINGVTTTQGMEVSFEDEPSRRIRVSDKVWDGGKHMLDWVKIHNRGWFGTGSKYAQAILTILNHQTPFLGVERGVEIVGLHGVEDGAPVFVLPDEVIGSAIAAERWRYTPPSTGAADFTQYKLAKPVLSTMDPQTFKDWAGPVAQALVGLNHAAIMTPLIAWAAAAPGRSLIREFPPFGVFGASGSGKTSTIRMVMINLFGLDEEHNLTSTTPHGVRVWISGTNGVAIWLDEFRRGASDSTMNFVLQSLRDGYTGSASSRGGYGDNKQDVHESRVSAPIIVSGEEALEERSHIDRVVAVSLRMKDLNPGALRRLEQSMGPGAIGRLGRAYLEWFIEELAEGRIVAPELRTERKEQGESVLEWGWSLWSRFCREICGVEMGDLDLSSVRGEREAASEHPIFDALGEAIEIGATEPGVQNDLPVAWVVEPGSEDGTKRSLVAVRVRAFQKWAVNAGYQFPGAERSTKSWLSDRFTVDRRLRARYGMSSNVRVLMLVGALEELQSDATSSTFEV